EGADQEDETDRLTLVPEALFVGHELVTRQHTHVGRQLSNDGVARLSDIGAPLEANHGEVVRPVGAIEYSAERRVADDEMAVRCERHAKLEQAGEFHAMAADLGLHRLPVMDRSED